MGCCEVCLKVVNGIFSAVLLIIGFALLAWGGFVTYMVYESHTPELRDEELLALPSICFLVFGIILLFMIFIGCFAICREATVCMEVYSVCLIILGVAQLILGAYLVIHYQTFQTMLSLQLKFSFDITSLMDNYGHNPDRMNTIQSWYSCCGARGVDDYRALTIPSSCCDDETQCSRQTAYQDNCVEAVYNTTLGMGLLLGWFSIIVGVTELIAAILGLVVSCNVWRKQTLSWA